MSAYGTIASSIVITNNSTASQPFTFTITDGVAPNQSDASWTLWHPVNVPLKYPLVIAPGQTVTIGYTVNVSNLSDGESALPFVLNYAISCKVAGTATTQTGWMEISTSAAGLVERPDYVNFGVSFQGQPASVCSQEQPDGDADPDPFVVSASTSTVTVDNSRSVSSLTLQCADALAEKILEGLIDP